MLGPPGLLSRFSQPCNVARVNPTRWCAQCGDNGLTPAETTLWFGSKALQPGKKLGEYLGRNEKTRATIKIQQTKAGAPPREPVSEA